MAATVLSPWPRRARAPHLFEIIEFANLGPEHVHDHVAGVDQHPVAVRHAFDPDAQGGALQRHHQMLGDGAHVALRAAGGHHHVIGDRGLAAQIDRGGVFRLVVVEVAEDERESLPGLGASLGNRCGSAFAGGRGTRGGQVWTGLFTSRIVVPARTLVRR